MLHLCIRFNSNFFRIKKQKLTWIKNNLEKTVYNAIQILVRCLSSVATGATTTLLDWTRTIIRVVSKKNPFNDFLYINIWSILVCGYLLTSHYIFYLQIIEHIQKYLKDFTNDNYQVIKHECQRSQTLKEFVRHKYIHEDL